MNDKKWIKLSKVLLIIASLMLICNGVYWHLCGSNAADNDDTTRTVESIKAEHEFVRNETESSEREVEAAEKHVERATGAVTGSEEAARRNAASTDELQTLIDECQGIVEAQRGIIRNVDRANGIRSAADAEN